MFFTPFSTETLRSYKSGKNLRVFLLSLVTKKYLLTERIETKSYHPITERQFDSKYQVKDDIRNSLLTPLFSFLC